MSLVKKPTRTAKKIAANRRNGRTSQGAATEEGKERIAAAQWRHGFYAQPPEVALRLLGEDPADYEELLQGLREEFRPVGTLPESLVKRLAWVLCLIDRTERRQEGDLLRRAKLADNGRENRLHARMMRLKMTAESLRSLARAVAERHYVTTQEDLEVMKKLHQEGVTAEMGEIALGLFYQLQAPGTGEDGVDPEEKRRRVVNSIRSIFGIGPIQKPVQMLTPAGKTLVVRPEGYEDPEDPAEAEEGDEAEKDDRYPEIPAEDWIARERARKLLRNILTRQAELCETQRRARLKETLAGPCAFELAAEIVPTPAEALLARRVQDANLREVRRLTNLLLKIQRQQRPRKPMEPGEGVPEGHDVQENKEG